MKRILKSFLPVLFITLCFCMTADAAPKISQKKASLAVGQKTSLKVKNAGKKKVKWSSSNKKVATVSSKGVVKAKKKGVAVITAKVGSKKLKCKVTVKKAKAVAVIPSSSSSAGSQTPSSGGYEAYGTPAPMTAEEIRVRNAITSYEKKYPTGSRWTNEIYYKWKGGVYAGGYGCAAFAFMLSDAAFGEKPARQTEDFSKIRIGDVLRMYNNSHVVIVIGKYTDGSLLIAEGNSGGEVYWGRLIAGAELKKINSVITRW